MREPSQPPRRGASGVVSEGFRPLPTDAGFESAPIYRVVEVVRDAEGRLRREGRVWHSDLALLRRFGRAVAANTSSHRVMITDAAGSIVEDLPVAPPESRHSAWDSWGGVALPPAPPIRPVARRVVAAPPPPPPFVHLNEADAGTEVAVAVAVAGDVDITVSPAADAGSASAQPALPAPPELPKLETNAVADADADAADELTSLVPDREEMLP